MFLLERNPKILCFYWNKIQKYYVFIGMESKNIMFLVTKSALISYICILKTKRDAGKGAGKTSKIKAF